MHPEINMTNTIAPICSQDICNWYLEKAPQRKFDSNLAEKCAGVVEDVLQTYIKDDAKIMARFELKKIFPDETNEVFFFQFVVPSMIENQAKIKISLDRYNPNLKKSYAIIYKKNVSHIPANTPSTDASTKGSVLSPSIEDNIHQRKLESKAEKDDPCDTNQSPNIPPKKPQQDAIKICSQDISNWYFEKAPKRKIDDNLAEKCAGVVEDILSNLKDPRKRIIRKEYKKTFQEDDNNIFFFQFTVVDLIEKHAQKRISFQKYSKKKEEDCVIIYHNEEIPYVSHSDVSSKLTKNNAVKIPRQIIAEGEAKAVVKAVTVANAILQECLENDSTFVEIASRPPYRGEVGNIDEKNSNFFLITLPRILKEKEMIIHDLTTKTISFLGKTHYLTSFYKIYTTRILNQVSEMFESNKKNGFASLFATFQPIYEGETYEIILKNSEFFLKILPKLLESKKIYIRRVVMEFLKTDSGNKFLVEYYRHPEVISNNNSVQKKSEYPQTTTVTEFLDSYYSTFIFAPRIMPLQETAASKNHETIKSTFQLPSSPPKISKSFNAASLNSTTPNFRMFSSQELALVAESDFPSITNPETLARVKTIANEFYLKCLEKSEGKDNFYVEIASCPPFSTEQENSYFFLKTLPKILQKKGILTFVDSIKKTDFLEETYYVTKFHKSNIVPIFEQISGKFERNECYFVMKRCPPIYDGESEEIIRKNSEFYAITLPKMLEAKKIYIRDAFVQFLKTESGNVYLIRYHRKSDTPSNNNSLQNESDNDPNAEVTKPVNSIYSKITDALPPASSQEPPVKTDI